MLFALILTSDAPSTVLGLPLIYKLFSIKRRARFCLLDSLEADLFAERVRLPRESAKALLFRSAEYGLDELMRIPPEE